MQLNLHHIEDAVRSNFIFEGKERRPEEQDTVYERRIACQHSLYTSKELEGSRLMGLAVFIGVARMYAFSSQDIMDYLGIDSSLFKDSLAFYDKFLQEAISIRVGGGEVPVGSKECKVYTKTAIIRNQINRVVRPVFTFPKG